MPALVLQYLLMTMWWWKNCTWHWRGLVTSTWCWSCEISLGAPSAVSSWSIWDTVLYHGRSGIASVLGIRLWKVTLLGSNLASVTALKRIQTPRSLCCDLGGYKTITTCWLGGRVPVWVQVWALVGHLAISLKTVPEDNRRIRGQTQWPSSWGSSDSLSPALLTLVGRSSTSTECFQVGYSCWWQRPWLAGLKKTCYHSIAILTQFKTQESTRF